ncbi:hypothetical protein [Pseudomonas auratipiscis]|uniref:Uncharacterized protein n=1 Tax=Pseudomonas auratipiscis TaxID=3115853 RepID=A0AB35X160_9PSED|nr:MULTISPECIES: hypothetical protein [unclassified Pseudomonas]MEE1869046.1 hypothetical protein [Pseudomonas sp. 120P]MEE1959693.1 hypothetical protein [Pseudomonas sp. 119P]
MSTNEFGMKAWGVCTVVLAIAALAVVVLGGAYIGSNGEFNSGAPQWIAGMYTALKDCGAIVAGILGFSGLAWSNFYKASTGIGK